MAHVSRPLVALLGATLAFFALWTVALKHSGSSGGGGSQGLSGLASAVAKAHHAVAASQAASAAEPGAGAPPATQSGSSTAQSPGAASSPATAGSASTAVSPPTTTPSAASPGGAAPSQAALSGSPATTSTAPAATGGAASSAGSSATAPSASTGPAALKAALKAHDVVVMLFYNPAGADDQAVKQELDSLYPPPGTLVQSAPIAQLAAYSSITGRVPVSQAPTLLFIDRHGNASEIVGFADDLEITQRLAATLAAN